MRFCIGLLLCLLFKQTLAQETAPVGPFHSLVVHGAFNVFLRQGTAPSVRIEALPRLAQLVQVRVADSVLYVIQQRYVPKLQRFNVIVTYTSLDAIQLVGTGEVISEGQWQGGHLRLDVQGNFNGNLNTDTHTLSLTLAGQGLVQLQGRADSLAVHTSGHYELNNGSMRTQTIQALFQGLGLQQLGAVRRIRARVSGAIDIRVLRTPLQYEVITLLPGQPSSLQDADK